MSQLASHGPPIHRFTDEVRPRLKTDKILVGEDRRSRLNEVTANARELYDAMLELYPDRVNSGSLWGAANTAKNQA
jgi:hypothetical protein